jgi:hypothetical protein
VGNKSAVIIAPFEAAEHSEDRRSASLSFAQWSLDGTARLLKPLSKKVNTNIENGFPNDAD